MLPEFFDRTSFEAVRNRMVFVAWYRYRIAPTDAEDIAQTALLTYIEVRERYREESNQFGILIGIFIKKCLVFLNRSMREAQGLRRLCGHAGAATEVRGLDPKGPGGHQDILDRLIAKEDALVIRAILDRLPESTRKMFSVLLDSGRQGLIEHYGLNPNTVDSRLHSARSDLRNRLRSEGLSA